MPTDEFRFAATQGDVAALREALAAGADPNAYTDGGKTPFLFACWYARPEAVRLLLQAGADIHLRVRDDEEDWTAVMFAATAQVEHDEQDQAEVLHLLADAGADLDAQDAEGNTALHLATTRQMGYPVAVQALLEQGADPTVRNAEGFTPLMYARQMQQEAGENPFMGPMLQPRADAIVALLEAAGPEAGDANVEEFLQAAKEGDAATVERLLARGLDLHTPPAPAALIDAAQGGHSSVVGTLLEAGADVNYARPGDGETALMRAAQAGHLGVVRRLVTAGADVHASDREGLDTMGYATLNRQRHVVDYLTSVGARVPDVATYRGFSGFSLNVEAVLVRAGVAETAEAVGRLTEARSVHPNVLGQAITATDVCVIVYRFREHAWTLIQTVHAEVSHNALDLEALARSLSRTLDTDAIYFVNIDTSAFLAYRWYERGEEIEALVDYPDPGEEPTSDPPLGFFVRGHAVEDHPLDDVEALADGFLRERDAYVPGWSNRARRVPPGQTIPYLSEPSDDFERVDFVAVR